MKVPNSLRTWFIIHFIVDIIFALPLLIAPIWFLSLFGFSVTETITPRLVGAALIGIGGTSFLIRDKSLGEFQALLTLKIIWSITAVIGLFASIIQGSPKATWLFLALFALFSGVWIYYKKTL